MPDPLPHACHNCTSLGDGTRTGRTAVPAPPPDDRHAGQRVRLLYWYPAKNAHLIAVPGHETMLSTDFEGVRALGP
jgi:hypothetical protein